MTFPGLLNVKLCNKFIGYVIQIYIFSSHSLMSPETSTDLKDAEKPYFVPFYPVLPIGQLWRHFYSFWNSYVAEAWAMNSREPIFADLKYLQQAAQPQPVPEPPQPPAVAKQNHAIEVTLLSKCMYIVIYRFSTSEVLLYLGIYFPHNVNII